MKTSLKSMTAVHIVAVAVSALLMSACEMKRDMAEMHDATMQMNDTTAKMNQTTEDLSTTSKGLAVQTGELYDALRQGDSLQLRRNALEKVIKSEDPVAKLSEGGKYFMSFEVQLWSGNGPDTTQEKRDMLALSAVREFFKDLPQFIPGADRRPKPLAGQIWASSKSNMVNSFNALSATMHLLNPKQEANIKAAKKPMKPISMYSLIEEALLMKPRIEAGEVSVDKVPEYISEVLANEKDALYLLQARYNYIPAVILGRSTDIAHKSTALHMYMSEWVLDLKSFNLVQIKELNLFVTGALMTRDLLKRLGQPTPMDPMLAKFYRNMHVVDTSLDVSTEKAGVQADFVKNLELLRQF